MSEPIDGGNGRVSFTVKELLANLEAKIDKLLAALEHKADLAQLTQARKDIMTLEGRLRAVEETQASSSLLLSQVNKIIDTQEAVKAALDEQADTVQHKADSAFNRRDKIWAAAVSTILLVVSILTLGPDLYK